jgi:hypothetical protein
MPLFRADRRRPVIVARHRLAAVYGARRDNSGRPVDVDMSYTNRTDSRGAVMQHDASAAGQLPRQEALRS